jgi:hypothetical protein
MLLPLKSAAGGSEAQNDQSGGDGHQDKTDDWDKPGNTKPANSDGDRDMRRVAPEPRKVGRTPSGNQGREQSRGEKNISKFIHELL